MPTTSRPVILWLALLLGASGCDSCQGDPVPFGLDASRRTAPAREAPPEARRTPPQTLPAGTRAVAVEGASLTLTDLELGADGAEGSLRAVWPMDVDDDGDLDAIAVWQAGRRAGVGFARREDDHFASPEALGSPLEVPAPAPKPAEEAAPEASEHEEPCALADPELDELGTRRARISLALSCGDSTVTSLILLDIAQTPRATLALSATGGLAMRPELELRDLDADGHDDLGVTLHLSGAGVPTTALPLSWLDRPGGLARDPAQPEEALIAAAEAAHGQLAQSPEDADRAAAGVLALRDALCGGSADGPALRVGGAALPCGPSAGAGLAAAIRVAAAARQGKLAEAVSRERELADGERFTLGPKGRRTLASAFASPAPDDAIHRRDLGPAGGAASANDAATALRFSADGRLVVRVGRTRALDLSTDPPTALPATDDAPPVVSADGRLALRSVHRTCDGYVADLVAAAQARPGPAILPGQEVLLEAVAPPAGVGCDPLPDSMLRDDGGLRVLGWAPQGLIVAQAGTLSLVPLTVTGVSAGERMPLAPSAPLPAPIHSATLSADGRRWVETSPHGVILHERGQGERWLSRVEEGAAPPRAVALSADGHRAAYLAGDRLFLLEGF